MALRLNSFCDWSVKNHMEECAQEDTHKTMKFWYECAVDEQKKEQREYKKKTKVQLPQVEPVPLTIESVEEELPQDQSDRPEAIKA